jgi:phage terminase large subunit GpA-like protein
MDALSDPTIHTVVVMSSAQVGKTEIVNNVVGYYIDQDPSPILVVQPTLDMGQAWSKDRLAPMIRDTKALKEKVKDSKAKDGGNTLKQKTFPGGHVTITGANSAAGLASRPIRILVMDEVDRFPVSAGTEGDPCALAAKRTTTYWNKKILMTSTPTIKGLSRIEMAYESGDRRQRWVPCPKCGEFQVLQWGQVVMERGEDGELDANTALYQCAGKHCKAKWTDAERIRADSFGEWRAREEPNGVASFHIFELYSPWVPLAATAGGFMAAKDNPELLQVWINTALGETWEDRGFTADPDSLAARCEDFGPEVPQEAVILTCGVDVQGDRLELEVVGWAPGLESWSMDYVTLPGDPTGPEVWNDLDRYLSKPWVHESGAMLQIEATCVDSGYCTDEVYRFCAGKGARFIFPVKGMAGEGKPLVGSPTRGNRYKVALYGLGVDSAKGTVYSRLRVGQPGPGYMHFPDGREPVYFSGLTAEKRVARKKRDGTVSREWVKTRARNEPLDIRVYAMAALTIKNPDLEALSKQAKQFAVEKMPHRETTVRQQVRQQQRTAQKREPIW